MKHDLLLQILQHWKKKTKKKMEGKSAWLLLENFRRPKQLPATQVKNQLSIIIMPAMLAKEEFFLVNAAFAFIQSTYKI